MLLSTTASTTLACVLLGSLECFNIRLTLAHAPMPRLTLALVSSVSPGQIPRTRVPAALGSPKVTFDDVFGLLIVLGGARFG